MVRITLRVTHDWAVDESELTYPIPRTSASRAHKSYHYDLLALQFAVSMFPSSIAKTTITCKRTMTIQKKLIASEIHPCCASKNRYKRISTHKNQVAHPK